MCSRFSFVVFLVALVFAPLAPARADVALEQQLRQVEARVELWGTVPDGDEGLLERKTDTATSAAAGPFSAALEVHADLSARTYGIATQTSTITPSRFQASGRIEGYADSNNTQSGGGGRSTFDVRFRADEPQAFTLAYDLVEDPNAYNEGTYEGLLSLTRLDAPGGVTVFEDPNAFPRSTNNPPPASVRGVLEPGTYRFLFHNSQVTDIGHGHRYEFTLDLATVPEPGALTLAAGALALLRRPRRAGRERSRASRQTASLD